MVDAQPGGTADDLHDDDELAEAMAAEFERWATGAVPVIPPRQSDAPAAAANAAPPARRPERPPAPDRGIPSRPGPSADQGFRRRPEPEPFLPSSAAPVTGPIRRRSGFVHPTPLPPAPVDPLDRVLPTAPTPLPEATGSLLEAMIDGSIDDAPRRARHADGPLPAPAPAPAPDDPLRSTGSLPLSSGLYADWEQSLRSIGRPSQDWVDDDVVPVGPDAPTVAVRVQPVGPRDAGRPTAAPVTDETGPMDFPTVRTAAPARRGAHTAPVETLDDDAVGPRPRGRRRAPIDAATTGPVAEAPSAAAVPVGDATGEQLRAPAAGVPEEVAEPRPRTSPVLIERVRTAILQLPTVSPSDTGSRGVALVGRWAGAFASPLTLVIGFAVGAAGGGPVGIAGLALGLLLMLPAAARAAARVVSEPRGDGLESQIAGRAAGRAIAAVLLIIRIAAAAVAVAGVGSVVAAYAARTGALGGSESAAGLIGVLATGVAAIAVTVWPPRVTAALTMVLAVLGIAVTALLVLVLGPSFGATSATPTVVITAATVGLAAVGLPLVLVGPDVARWRTAVARPGAIVAGTVLAGLSGFALLVLACAGAASPLAGSDPADAFAGAVADATAAPLAGPLGIALLIASCTLPALLLRSSGAAAARLVGAPGSERLGVLATGLLAVAGALAMTATGAQAADAVVVLAATAGVPVAAWAGVVTTARFRGPRGGIVGGGVLVASVAGWVLTDGVGFSGERSPVLAAVGMTQGPWAGGLLVGLAAAFLVGIVVGLAGRFGGSRPAEAPDAADSLGV